MNSRLNAFLKNPPKTVAIAGDVVYEEQERRYRMDDLRDSNRVLNGKVDLSPSLTSNTIEKTFLTSIAPPAAIENVSLCNINCLSHLNKNKGNRGK